MHIDLYHIGVKPGLGLGTSATKKASIVNKRKSLLYNVLNQCISPY